MGISVYSKFSVRYHKKSCPLEKQDFVGVDDISKVRQTTFEFFKHINYMDNQAYRKEDEKLVIHRKKIKLYSVGGSCPKSMFKALTVEEF